MTGILLTLAFAVAQTPAETPRPSEAQLKRARDLLAGTWELTSVVDNGENLGPALIRAKVAVDGKVTIGERMIQIVAPETKTERVSAYRINPAADPRWIDLITETDKLLKGVYKFDGDELVICLQNKEGAPRPGGFEAPSGSNRVVMKMHLLSSASVPEPRKVKRDATPPTFDDELFPARPADSPSPAQLAVAPAPAATVNRTLSESQIRRAQQMLFGSWQVVGLERNGESIGAKLFREKISRDGLVTIGNRVVTMISPQSGEKRISGYRIDPSQDPRHFDLITEFDDVERGIYKFEKDELWICLNQESESVRPTAFSAPDGSNNMFIRLKLVPAETTATPTPAAAPTPTVARSAPSRPAAPPEPSREEKARQQEQLIKKMLLGSWTFTDSKGTLVLLLSADGTLTATRYWAKVAKRLFEGSSTTSRGQWRYDKGWLRVDVLSSQDSSLAGRSYHTRLRTVGDDTAVVEDVFGKLKTYRRLN